jgi:tetratricopeptide (TPR) repeat protein
MNARRRSTRRDSRSSNAHPVPDPSQRGNWRRLVVPAGLLGLVLVILGIFPRPQNPPRHSGPPSPPLGATPGGDESVQKTAEVFPEADDNPLPPVLSESSSLEAWKLETKRVAARLVEAFPDRVDAVQTSAMIHWALGDMTEAVRLSEQCLAIDDQFPLAYEGLGRVSLLQGDFERAIAMFRQALALEPRNRHVTMLLAEALARANRADEVVAELSSFVESGPVPPTAYTMLGQAYLNLEQYHDAQRVLEVAMRQVPDERQVHFALMKTYEHLGQHDKADWHRNRVEQLVDVYREGGKGWVRAVGGPDRLFDDVVRAHKDAAAVYARHGAIADAERLWRTAAELDPKDVESRRSLAVLYNRTGRASQARRIGQQLHKLAADAASGSRSP